MPITIATANSSVLLPTSTILKSLWPNMTIHDHYANTPASLAALQTNPKASLLPSLAFPKSVSDLETADTNTRTTPAWTQHTSNHADCAVSAVPCNSIAPTGKGTTALMTNAKQHN
jgi:hypothetical protein